MDAMRPREFCRSSGPGGGVAALLARLAHALLNSPTWSSGREAFAVCGYRGLLTVTADELVVGEVDELEAGGKKVTAIDRLLRFKLSALNDLEKAW